MAALSTQTKQSTLESLTFSYTRKPKIDTYVLYSSHNTPSFHLHTFHPTPHTCGDIALYSIASHTLITMASSIRYFLEKSIPELEELQAKGVFSKPEITMIMRKRTDFEQRISGRGSTPRDFLKYQEWEKNLEYLRKKRVTRLEIKGGGRSNLRRQLFIMERATKKYPAENALWTKYLEVARDAGAVKNTYEVYSKLLRLQPTNIDAWLLAAKYQFEDNADAQGARTLLQRGLRINPELTRLWLAYCQFELTYIAKLLARRRLMGLMSDEAQEADMKKTDDNAIMLPTSDGDLTLPDADMNMLGNPESNPALRGDIALAVYDSAIAELLKTHDFWTLVPKFMAVFDKFDQRDRLYAHVLDTLPKDDVRTWLLEICLPIRTVTVSDPEFADQLQMAVNKFVAFQARKHSPELAAQFVARLETFISDNSGVNDVIRKIIQRVNRV